MFTYTVDQANRMLPTLRAYLSQLRELKGEIRGEWSTFEHELGADANGERALVDAINGSVIGDLALQYNEILKEISDKRIVCRSVEQGLFDFPYLVGSQTVHLCWREDEQSIQYWHARNAGFSSRKLLVEVPAPVQYQGLVH